MLKKIMLVLLMVAAFAMADYQTEMFAMTSQGIIFMNDSVTITEYTIKNDADTAKMNHIMEVLNRASTDTTYTEFDAVSEKITICESDTSCTAKLTVSIKSNESIRIIADLPDSTYILAGYDVVDDYSVESVGVLMGLLVLVGGFFGIKVKVRPTKKKLVDVTKTATAETENK